MDHDNDWIELWEQMWIVLHKFASFCLHCQYLRDDNAKGATTILRIASTIVSLLVSVFIHAYRLFLTFGNGQTLMQTQCI